MKITTVLFKDNDNMFYIGELSDGKIVEFKNIQIRADMKDISKFNMKLNEFMLLDMEAVGQQVKLTPLSIGTLSINVPTSPDTSEKLTADLYDIPPETLIGLFNDILDSRQANESKVDSL